MWTAKTETTGQMPRLIWVFTGRMGNFVGFVVSDYIRLHQQNAINQQSQEQGCTL